MTDQVVLPEVALRVWTGRRGLRARARACIIASNRTARRAEDSACARSRTVARCTGRWLLVAAFSGALPVPAAGSGEMRWDPNSSVVGEMAVYEARFDDTLLDVARRFGMGLEEMKLANPGVDVWLPGKGTAIRLPSRHVLPSSPRRGVVINVPEMRLYYYPRDGTRVRTWPISIGRLEYETPLGRTTVVRKKVGPVWYPTDSIREEYAARGETLPPMVNPGPDNPLGSHALYLGFPTYLIHGTNRPHSIGMRVSHGCVRLYPEDIVELYDLVAPGTSVSIVDQRVKAGWLGNELYLEVHPNPGVPADQPRPNMTDAVRAIIAATLEAVELPPVDWGSVEAALAAANGVPTVVGKRTVEPKLEDARSALAASAAESPERSG